MRRLPTAVTDIGTDVFTGASDLLSLPGAEPPPAKRARRGRGCVIGCWRSDCTCSANHFSPGSSMSWHGRFSDYCCCCEGFATYPGPMLTSPTRFWSMPTRVSRTQTRTRLHVFGRRSGTQSRNNEPASQTLLRMPGCRSRPSSTASRADSLGRGGPFTLWGGHRSRMY